MEVQVTDTFGLEDDVLVSIRYGTVRRQAPLESVKSHPFKFPAQLEELSEPLKIDLLKPVASTRLVLHPKEEHYSIGFEQEDSIAMGLHIMAGTPDAEANPGPKETSSKDSASTAKDYLEQKGLLKYVQSLLHAVIQDKPADPFSYMIEQLTAAKSKSTTCERIMSRPTSAISRPTSAVARPTTSRPVSARPNPPKQKPVAEAPAPREEPPSFPEPVSPPPKRERPPMREIPEQSALPVKDPAVEQAFDQRTEAKQELMQKLMSAAESGNLGAVLSSVGLDQSRQRIQTLLEKSAESGDLEAALQIAMNQKELGDILRLKTEMREVLQEATDSGKMKTMLDEMAAEKREQQVQGELRDALFEANESGKMAKILDEIAKKPAVPEPVDEAEQLKTQLRDALLEANESGKMNQVLEAMAADSQVQSELTDVMRIKLQLKQVLSEANEMGKMKEVLKQIVRETPPAEPSAEDERVLSELRGTLLEANESGKLPQVLKEIAPQKGTAAADVTGSALPPSKKAPEEGETLDRSPHTVPSSIKKAMLDAAKSGQLAEVLDGMDTTGSSGTQAEAAVEPVAAVPVKAVPVKAVPTEVEALRENVRAKVQESLANGVLEEGLLTLQRKKSQDAGPPATAPVQPNKSDSKGEEDLKKLGQEICGVLQEASKSGKLDEALELLRQEQHEVVQAAPQDDMDAVRNNLSSLMKDALLSGQLNAALEELKIKSEPPLSVTDIHAIKAKFKKLLRDALEEGILASKVGKLKLIPKAPPAPPSGSPPDEMDVLKLHLREALQHAAEAGHLAEALASLRSGPSEGVEQTMLELQSTLTEAALSGTLAETLRSLREATSGFNTTQTQDGEASAEAAAAQQIAEETELEELRGRLRSILSGAYDQGILEQVVQQAVKTQAESPEGLPALKAQVAQMRSESEALHSTVERLLQEKQELQRNNDSMTQRLEAEGTTMPDP